MSFGIAGPCVRKDRLRPVRAASENAGPRGRASSSLVTRSFAGRNMPCRSTAPAQVARPHVAWDNQMDVHVRAFREYAGDRLQTGPVISPVTWSIDKNDLTFARLRDPFRQDVHRSNRFNRNSKFVGQRGQRRGRGWVHGNHADRPACRQRGCRELHQTGRFPSARRDPPEPQRLPRRLRFPAADRSLRGASSPRGPGLPNGGSRRTAFTRLRVGNRSNAFEECLRRHGRFHAIDDLLAQRLIHFSRHQARV